MQACLIKMKNKRQDEYGKDQRDPKRDKNKKKDFTQERNRKRNYE